MDFFLVGVIFWVLFSVASVLLVFGLWKSSSKQLIMSGCAFLLPTLYFAGAENWLRLLIFLPMVLFVLAFFISKSRKIPSRN
ncbi:hypothetical protein [Oceanobacillus kapialis]|uniref:Uncharacterized protein n=1 Tax=Oceanobacillus kapialis TaxID=481353 RepID=A0ABW5Q452_9BACI